jgi:hypothetical protein
MTELMHEKKDRHTQQQTNNIHKHIKNTEIKNERQKKQFRKQESRNK